MSYITFFENVAGPRADEVDLEVYFGVVIGFTLCLPHICVRSTSSQPQVDFQVNLVRTGLCPYTQQTGRRHVSDRVVVGMIPVAFHGKPFKLRYVSNDCGCFSDCLLYTSDAADE